LTIKSDPGLSVILSAAKEILRQAGRAPGPQILRGAQDDRLALPILVVKGHYKGA